MSENTSPHDFLEQVKACSHEPWAPKQLPSTLEEFYLGYKNTLATHGIDIKKYESMFVTFLQLLKKQFESPFSFQPYHRALRAPFDYFSFGINFVKPLIDMSHSSVRGIENLDEIIEHLRQGHNVILLSNHQTEADPQAISVLLERTHLSYIEDLIFVAGERVITDPLAIPFSMGCNLLCIYSKRYIDHPPEQKMKKQLHNKRTMELMSELLCEGGKSIYVAPSGGRDRANANGVVEVAAFDPQSIEMFYLMAKKSDKPTYFYTLSLATYDLLPPPETIKIELGEQRIAKRGGIHLYFGAKIDMECFPGSDITDKHARRKARSDYIWNQVNRNYLEISKKGATS